MPNIEDWQQVAVSYAQENINLKAQLAALARTINAMEAANASNNGASETVGRERIGAEASGEED